MSIKVEVNEPSKVPVIKPFPKLMKGTVTGRIILAVMSVTRPDGKNMFYVGTELYPDLGYTSDEFLGEHFIDFEGSITLTSE